MKISDQTFFGGLFDEVVRVLGTVPVETGTFHLNNLGNVNKDYIL